MNCIGLKRRQRGATFLGILIIVSIIGFALYAGIRLLPIYQEYMSIARILDQAGSKLSASASQAEIRQDLQNRWTVDYVTTLSPKDVEITKVGNKTQLRAQYRAEAPFIANISLVVDFDKTVFLGGATAP